MTVFFLVMLHHFNPVFRRPTSAEKFWCRTYFQQSTGSQVAAFPFNCMTAPRACSHLQQHSEMKYAWRPAKISTDQNQLTDQFGFQQQQFFLKQRKFFGPQANRIFLFPSSAVFCRISWTYDCTPHIFSLLALLQNFSASGIHYKAPADQKSTFVLHGFQQEPVSFSAHFWRTENFQTGTTRPLLYSQQSHFVVFSCTA